MKGIAHFMTGVAAASFFPWTVQAAMEGNPLYFVLGGAFGILPDTLDFKLYRFFYKHAYYVDPDPLKPDPQAVADTLARAVRDAHTNRHSVRVKLNTVRLGADFWQQYKVEFAPDKQEVRAWFGPVVTTGQVPVPGAPPPTRSRGAAALPCPVVQTYDPVTQVDIFDGPSLELVPDEQGRVVIEFLPWHRTWSHSLLTGVFWAALGALLWDWRAALVIVSGYCAHILEDQLGLMGSNLFWPITRKRFQGLHFMRSGDALPNFAAVWLSCLCIFWNLYRNTPGTMFTLSFLELLAYAAVLPSAVVLCIHAWLKRIGQYEPPSTNEEEKEEDPLLS
jgi:hypothetical protein